MEQKTVSAETETQYAEIARRLLRRFAAARGLEDWSLDALGVGEWFRAEAEHKHWSKRTLWLYKAALIYFMRRYGPVETVMALQQVSAGGSPAKGNRTSSLKNKSLPAKDMDVLIADLLVSEHGMDPLLADWLRAGRAAGLRPCEWEHAELNGNTLVVKNAKVNELRGHGEYRTLVLPEDSKWGVVAVRDFLDALHEILGGRRDFQHVYKACRERMRLACRRLWPRRKLHPTLYSARHQFVADMKSRGMSLDAIAALMGHATDATASEHYGRKAAGEMGGASAQARAEEVERVRKIFHGRTRKRPM